jgi:acylphosphatase
MTGGTVCGRAVIHGRVQGVGYRAWVEAEAPALGLAGFVRNRRDGSVEAVFCGSAKAVADMIERCRAGPRHAQVTRVDTSDVGEELSRLAPANGFMVLPTV